MRWDRSHVGGTTDAMFLGSDIQVLTASGSVEASVIQQSGSLTLVGTWANRYERAELRRTLLGIPQAGLGTGSSDVVSTPRTGTVPSWTNVHLNRNYAYVLTPLSSSDHETQVLNLWKSGTQQVESSAVPASRSLYYTKTGYTHVVVKKTASYLDTTFIKDSAYPVQFVTGAGTDMTWVTGSINFGVGVLNLDSSSGFASSVAIASAIQINVPFKGKIADIKVWIELAQVSGSGATGNGNYKLGLLGISLRSPNVKWGHAIPLRNDANLKRILTSDQQDFTLWYQPGPLASIYSSLFGPGNIANFYRDTFILWEGPQSIGTDTAATQTAAGPWNTENFEVTGRYPSWQRDRSMRTVFSDGAAVPNPRHFGAIANSFSSSGSYNGAPNSYFGLNNAWGFDVPWTSQTEISGANTYALAGSPPKGWLTGPGGTNDVNEWPTTGVNYGANEIRPLYPLLDPIYQRKRYGGDLKLMTSSFQVLHPEQWTGYRPGLRGTEASGTWTLFIYDQGSIQPTYCPTYFRQVRIELTLASSSYDAFTYRAGSAVRPFRKSTEELWCSLSGSDGIGAGTGSYDAFMSDTYLLRQDARCEIGRTFGVTFLTGNLLNTDAALYYRLSGALSDLSGSTPAWLLNNPFGVPVIPFSSASLISNDQVDVSSVHPQDILTVQTTLAGARLLTDAARDASAPETLADRFAGVLSGTST